jgi:hypothetical protein
MAMIALFRCVVGVVCSIALLVGAPAFAQQTRGEIFGRVVDTTGSVLPGVTVTLTSPALIQPQSVVTAVSGGYRFPQVPIGTYTVTFELAGFRRVVRDGVIIETGFNAEINSTLEVSTVVETITVTGESPVIDTRSTSLASRFNKDLLEKLPSARDPWVILEQTPGMVMDRQNVGGSASGQQSSFAAHGSGANQTWNLDGATITDMASASSPTYYDFEAFEEIQIQTGGMDASQEGGGVTINFVTKSGSNAFKGTARGFVTDQKFQAANTPAEVAAQGGGAGNPLKNINEYGIEVGGPIVKNRAWFWGAVSKQSIKVGVLGFLKAGAPAGSTNPDDLETDLTGLNNQNVKLNYQVATGHKSTFMWSRGDKIRNTRNASATTRLAATVRQTGPTNYWKGEHQWVVNDRLLLDGQYTYNDSGFLLNFHTDDLATVQRLNYVDTGVLDRAGTLSDNIRPTYESRVDGNYYLADFLGGDHSTKFGVRYRATPYTTITRTGGGATARIRASGINEVDVTRDGYSPRDLWEYSAYFNDSWKVRRATINWGVRYDRQDDYAPPATTSANPLLPDLLPAIEFKGVDTGVVYNNVSPRLGITWDLRGDGKTILKASAARYYGIGIYTAGTLSPTGQTTLSYYWNDLNGDLFVQRNEIDFARGFRATPSANYDPANPSAVRTPNTVDPNLENDTTNELIVGLDHELTRNFGVGVSYIRRKYSDFQDAYRVGVTSDSYAPVSFTRACGNTSCDQPTYSGVYYQRPTALPTGTMLRNYDYYRNYHGFELTARKRFSNGWLMNSSFTYNNTKFFYPTRSDFATSADPTNYDFSNGYDSGGTNGPRWILKLAGMYALPWGMSVSAFYNAREGFQFNRTIQSPNRTGSLGTVNVLIEPQGTTHYPAFRELDLHWDKSFAVSGRRVILSVDGFNMTNAATVLARATRQDQARANFVDTILSPRVARVGLKINF